MLTEDEKKLELELVKKSAKGDRESFRLLFEKYHQRAYNLAFSIMRNDADAEEVLQEAFVKAWLALPKFKGDSSFYTWLYRIVRNMAIDVKRKLSRRLQVAKFDQDDSRMSQADGHNQLAQSPEKDLLNRESLSFVQKALDSLKEDQRTMITLREIEGLTYDEISNVTGLNSGTVMSRLFYARKALKNALTRLEDSEAVTLEGAS